MGQRYWGILGKFFFSSLSHRFFVSRDLWSLRIIGSGNLRLGFRGGRAYAAAEARTKGFGGISGTILSQSKNSVAGILILEFRCCDVENLLTIDRIWKDKYNPA